MFYWGVLPPLCSSFSKANQPVCSATAGERRENVLFSIIIIPHLDAVPWPSPSPQPKEQCNLYT